MIPALRDLQHPFALPIDQPALAVEPARPPAGELSFHRLGFAGTLERRPLVFLDDSVDRQTRPLRHRGPGNLRYQNTTKAPPEHHQTAIAFLSRENG